MKNKFTLSMVVLTLLFGFIACSDKEDLTGDEAKEALIGKWITISITDEEGTYDYEHECNSKKDYVEFQRGSVMRSVYFEDDCSEEIEIGTYAVNGDKLTISGEDVGSGTFTFKITGKDLVLEDNGETIRLKKM